ncbi:MAG: hypothetical protein H7249_04470 [Chitinophagaceae bacterium]|nr:hypothetical protein [Oligoflexus sp.]
MLKTWQKLSLIACGLACSPAQSQTRSQVTGDSNAKEAQTLYLRGDVSSTTFDSKAAGSKDSHSSIAYEVGGWFGESRVVGLSVRNSIDVVPFTLNQSESATNFTDVRLRGRLWGIMPSVGVSLSEIDVKNKDVKTVGLFGTGMNMGLGWTGTLYPGIVLNGDAMLVKSTHIFDKLAQGTQLGNRKEADVHIAFDVTERILDFLVGYRLRKYDIITKDTTFAEQAAGVYVGVRLGVYF